MTRALAPTFDVLVGGAGPAGSATALMLARAGWHVGVLRRSISALPRTGETLPSASRSPLRALGVWSRFLSDGHLPSPGVVSWWDAERPAQQDSLFDPSGHPWHVDRQRFDGMLLGAAIEAGADAIEDVRVLDARPEGGGDATHPWRFALLTEGRLHACAARVLISATGRAVSLGPKGIERRRLDRLIGVGATIAASSGEADERTWIEATAEGWWYSAPTPSGQWTVTFFTDADRAPACEGRRTLSRYWLGQLAQAPNTARRLRCLDVAPGALSPTRLAGALRVMAADSYRKVPCQGPRWLAVGDASSAWDPLTGQGIDKALRSGLRAAHTADAVLRSADGGVAALADYARHEEEQDRQYRERYRAYYAQVRRWPDAVFWRRRQTASQV